jgi:hypothetical protein
MLRLRQHRWSWLPVALELEAGGGGGGGGRSSIKGTAFICSVALARGEAEA